MKRLGSSESLGAFMSICSTQTEEQSPRNGHVYGREFQSMLEGLDEEGCVEESGHGGGCGGGSEKKRRLSVDQVKALEKNFEIENKLEPERKVRLATELGLQPRQVAVWFQNRRARWKTKQLERDYGTLKARYESLEVSYEDLKHEKNELLKKVEELKSKLKGGGSNESEQNQIPVKGEGLVGSDPNDKVMEMSDTAAAGPDKALKFSAAADLKDGSSDSDSSAILHEERSPIAAANSSSPSNCGGGLQHQFVVSAAPGSSSSSAAAAAVMGWYHQLHPSKAMYQSQFVKEEHNFFGAEETCDIFSDEQPPTLQQWYSSEEQWN